MPLIKLTDQHYESTENIKSVQVTPSNQVVVRTATEGVIVPNDYGKGAYHTLDRIIKLVNGCTAPDDNFCLLIDEVIAAWNSHGNSPALGERRMRARAALEAAIKRLGGS